MSEKKAEYEVIEYEGREAKHYPQSGAIFDAETGRIVANTGGRPGMADGIASEIVTKRWADRDEAVLQGLILAADELGIGSLPTNMLAEIVKARAITAASSSGKAGNDAARFIFTIVDGREDGGQQRSAAMEIKLSDKMAEYILDRMIEE